MQTFVESITYPNAVAYVKVSDLLKRIGRSTPATGAQPSLPS